MSLLAAIYDLPKLGLVCPFDRGQASGMGSRWIAFHHFTPEPELVDWIAEARPFVLTTVRHPGDVLISLYHHLRGFGAEPVDVEQLRQMLHRPFPRGEIYPPAVHTFAGELACSIEWKRTGLARLVRYEDLRRHTMQTLLELTAWMGAVSTERIEQAIERCDIQLMRGLAGKHGGFFRSGEVGGWRSVLTAEIIEDFRAEPYRTQFEELGYSLDAAGDEETSGGAQVVSRNPFRTVTNFDNGVKAAPIVIDLYLSSERTMRERWQAVASTGPQSYFAWLNEARDSGETGPYAAIRISNLLHYLRETRPDLAQKFVNLNGSDRVGFAEWLMRYAESEFGIDEIFLTGLRESYLAWGLARSKDDPWLDRPSAGQEGSYEAIGMSNLLYYFHQTRPNVAQQFPNLAGSDRAEFAEWLLRYVNSKYRMDAVFLTGLWTSYLEWGTARAKEDGERRPWWPRLTNFALHVYRLSPHLRETFPDIYRRDRWDYLDWLVRPNNGLLAIPGVIEPIRENLKRVSRLRRVLNRFAGH